MKERQARPVNLDLQTIHFPVSAIASIVHRISGVIMFVSVGILLWLLATSLSSPMGFAQASSLVDSFVVKFVLWGILTALAYHICGGIRHLLMDLKCFEEKESGAMSAKAVFVVTAILSVLAGVLVC